VSVIILYPELYGLIPKVEELFTYEHPDYDGNFIPDWMKQMGMFPTAQMENGSFRMFNPNFPYQDLNRIPLVWEEGRMLPRVDVSEVKDDIVNAMHPAIRSFMSLATGQGYDFFRKQDLGEDAPAPYLMSLLASNPGIIGMVDGIQRARGKESNMSIGEDGKLMMDARTAQLLEMNMPLLRWAEFLFYLPQQVFPGLEEIIESVSGAEDDYEGMEETLQLMSYYLGIKFSPADVEQEKARIRRDIYYSARDELSAQTRNDPERRLSREQSRERVNESIRRLGG